MRNWLIPWRGRSDPHDTPGNAPVTKRGDRRGLRPLTVLLVSALVAVATATPIAASTTVAADGGTVTSTSVDAAGCSDMIRSLKVVAADPVYGPRLLKVLPKSVIDAATDADCTIVTDQGTTQTAGPVGILSYGTTYGFWKQMDFNILGWSIFHGRVDTGHQVDRRHPLHEDVGRRLLSDQRTWVLRWLRSGWLVRHLQPADRQHCRAGIEDFLDFPDPAAAVEAVGRGCATTRTRTAGPPRRGAARA